MSVALRFALFAALGSSGAARAEAPLWSVVQSMRRVPQAVAAPPPLVDFGAALFDDRRLSANGDLACATCHLASKSFTDGLERPESAHDLGFNVPTIVALGRAPWLMHDGRAANLAAQALEPLLSEREHGLTPETLCAKVAKYHANEYTRAFGEAPVCLGRATSKQTPKGRLAPYIGEDGTMIGAGRVTWNVATAIAAHVGRLDFADAPFDRFVDRLRSASSDEEALGLGFDASALAGLRLFVGKARCVACHAGPRFTNDGFTNIGRTLEAKTAARPGRAAAIGYLRDSPFDCSTSTLRPAWLGGGAACPELTDGGRVGAVRVPALRDVANTGPYMTDGSLATLRAVVEFYAGGVGNADIGAVDPLVHTAPRLGKTEVEDLVAFLATLSSAVTSDLPKIAPIAHSTRGQLGPYRSEDGKWGLTLAVDALEQFRGGQMTSLEAAITDATGRLARVASMTFEARMPAHGHGMETSPVPQRIADGVFRIERVKLHMPGSWVLLVEAVVDERRVRFWVPVER